MKKNSFFTCLIIIFLLLPITYIKGINPPSANIIMLNNFNGESFLNSIALSGNGQYLVASTDDFSGTGNVSLIKIPNSLSSQPELTWLIDQDSARSVKIDQDGSKIIYTDIDHEYLYCLSKDTNTPIWQIQTKSPYCDISDNGAYVVYTDYLEVNRAYCIDSNDGTLIWEKDIGTSLIRDIKISNSGDTAVLLLNNTLMYFNLEGLHWQKDLVKYTVKIEISNDGRVLVSSLDETSDVVLYNNLGEILMNITNLQISNYGFDIAKDSNEIILATYDSNLPNNKLVAYNFPSSNPSWSIPTNVKNNYAQISNNGKIAVISDYDYNVKIIDISTGSIVLNHTTGSFIVDIDISNDGTIVAVLLNDGTMIVYAISLPVEDASILEKYLGTFTDLDNIYGLGTALLVGLIIGGLIFGLRKKK